MLVNGIPAKSDTQGILTQLSSLNSSFPNSIGTKVSPPLTNSVVRAYNDGLQLLNQGNPSKALEQFAAAEKQLPLGLSHKIFLADINSSMAAAYQATGNFAEAEKRFKNSITLATDEKEYFRVENSHKNLANLHRINGTLDSYELENRGLLNKRQQNNDQQGELQARLALGATNRSKGNSQEAVEQYAKAYDLQQGKVDYDAHRVEQHEVGFSNKEKIGTDNIQQCVAVILHDPVTKKTALAHIDKFTDAASLSDVIKQFPPGTNLNAYLVGGRDRSPGSKEVSDENIRKVTTELQKHSSVNIKAADVGDKGAPSGIVFDPQTAKLEHAVPGKSHETTPQRKLLLNITPKLNFAFDFTKSKDIKVVELTNQQKEQIVRNHLSSKVTGSESWSANVLAEPTAIVAAKIVKTDPHIANAAINKHVEQKLSEKFGGQVVNKTQIDTERANLVKTAMESLRTDDKPLMAKPVVNHSMAKPVVNHSMAKPVVNHSMAKPVVNHSMAKPVVNSTGLLSELGHKIKKNPWKTIGTVLLATAFPVGTIIAGAIATGVVVKSGYDAHVNKKENFSIPPLPKTPEVRVKENIINNNRPTSIEVQKFVDNFRKNHGDLPKAAHTPKVISGHKKSQDKSQGR